MSDPIIIPSKDLIESDDPKNLYKEKWPDVKGMFSKEMGKMCTTKTFLDRFPIIALVQTYKLSYLYNDVVAGVSVGMTAIPQCIAYAAIAGIDSKYGLNAAFIACFLYTIFGSGVEMSLGPTAIMSLMIQKYVLDGAEFAVFISFIMGIIVLILWALRLEFLVQFISIPVTAGFTTAAAITIACGQVKSLFGTPGRSSEFIGTIEDFIRDIKLVQLWDTVLGVTMIIILLCLWKLKDVKGKLAPVLKYVSLGRNAIVVIIGTLLAYFMTSENFEGPFSLTGHTETGLPSISLPPFSITNNQNVTMNFGEMLEHVGTGFVTIPLIAILEVIAVSKAFANGRQINANQEIMALGIINFLGSFLQTMPVTGAFSRSAINKASGCRSTVSSLVTGIIVLIASTFLTAVFPYIPKTVLAAVIIAAMILMVEFKEAYHIWKTKRVDIIPLVVTLVTCLAISIEYGIMIGVGVNVLFIIYPSARPQISTQEVVIDGHRILLVEPDQSLQFPAAEYLKIRVMKKTVEMPDVKIIVLDGTYVKMIDTTFAENMRTCLKDLKINNKTLIFWNWKEQPTHLAWRMDENFGKSFYQSKTLNDLMLTINEKNILN